MNENSNLENNNNQAEPHPSDLRKEGKPQWNLVDFKSLEPLVRALEFGVTKHGKFSYRNHIPADVLIDKMMRHLIEIQAGNFIDEETGEHHIGGVLANAMFYSYHHLYNDKLPRPDSIIISTPHVYTPGTGNPAPYITMTASHGYTTYTQSTREYELESILELSKTKTNKEIAKQLGVSERTIYRRLKQYKDA